MSDSKFRPCPVCGIAVHPECDYQPFCSNRCQQIDLGRWAGGNYSIPGNPAIPWELDDSDDPKLQ